MSETKRTPGPWKSEVVVSDRGGWDVPVQHVTISAGDQIIAYYETRFVEYPSDEENEANAEFIVRATNCHDDLLAACERLTNAMIGDANCPYCGVAMAAHLDGENPDDCPWMLGRAATAKAYQKPA